MYYQQLSDEEILSGFREGDADIIREYFYGYCQVGYNIFISTGTVRWAITSSTSGISCARRRTWTSCRWLTSMRYT